MRWQWIRTSTALLCSTLSQLRINIQAFSTSLTRQQESKGRVVPCSRRCIARRQHLPRRQYWHTLQLQGYQAELHICHCQYCRGILYLGQCYVHSRRCHSHSANPVEEVSIYESKRRQMTSSPGLMFLHWTSGSFFDESQSAHVYSRIITVYA